MRILAWAVFLYWLVRGADFVVGSAWRLKRLKAAATPSDTPKISVIFAARNEENRVGEAVRSMLAQNYTDFEVIAVNDRSDDRTLSRLREIRDKRLTLVDIRELPAGWLGKNHALRAGYAASSGSWLLFTDADVEFHPETLRASIAAVQTHALDHLALFPKVHLKSYLETLFVSYFSLVFAMRFRVWAAQSTRSKAYIGIGAFNLVRREIYEKIGTHQALALDIADDMVLGKMIKQSGGRQAGMAGADFIAVRWVEGWRGVLNALHKNGFRGLNFNWAHLFIVSAGMLVIDVLPFLGTLFYGGVTGLLFLGALACIAACYVAGSRYTPESLLAFPAHAGASLLFNFILWRSALSTLRTGGVGWRGTVYPLDSLRKNSTPL